MAQELLPNGENQGTNPVTQASNKFLARRAFWKTAEVAHDTFRYATLPLRLAGNIVKDTFHLVDDMDSMSQMGFVFYEGLIGISSAPLALAGGIAILASNPVGWATIALGIGLSAAGVLGESINIGGLAVGIGKGIVDTYQHTREKNQSLREIRATRRANWQ